MAAINPADQRRHFWIIRKMPGSAACGCDAMPLVVTAIARCKFGAADRGSILAFVQVGNADAIF